MTEIHPILEICRAFPENYEKLDGDFLDKLNLLLVALKIFQASNRDEVFEILKILIELEIVEMDNNNQVKRSAIAQKVVEYYGK